MNIKLIAAAVCSLGALGNASAASYAFSMPVAPAAPFVSFAQVSGASFTDYWNFTAPANSFSISVSVISSDLLPFFNIDGLQVALFGGVDGAGGLIFAGGTGEASELQNYPISPSANYSFRVTGLVTTGAGYYVFQTIASPIPEPQTYAMLLAGLGAVGLLVLRRRQPN